MRSHKSICHSRKFLSGIQILVFLLNILGPLPTAKADEVFLPKPGAMITTSAPFSPAIITGMTIHQENPLQFDFIVDTGDEHLQGEIFKKESQKLINYFMATLTIPEDEMWVNLSPYEKNRIIAEGLGNTEMGRDMLAQDYILKQLTASLIYPESNLGKEFWQRIYAKAQKQFGTTKIPTNLFNKVWIVPQDATVYVNGHNVFVTHSHLKVMLEEDYLSLDKHNGQTVLPASSTVIPAKVGIQTQAHSLGSQMVRKIVLPAIEKEVNEGKNFANLRQIYNSMILATWYKKKLKSSLLSQIYLDKNKTNGIELSDKTVKEKIYRQYLSAYKKGVYDYIKEDIDSQTKEVIPRKYFSGGLKGVDQASLAEAKPSEEWIRRQTGRIHVVIKVAARFLTRTLNRRASKTNDTPITYDRFDIDYSKNGGSYYIATHEDLGRTISLADSSRRVKGREKSIIISVGSGFCFNEYLLAKTRKASVIAIDLNEGIIRKVAETFGLLEISNGVFSNHNSNADFDLTLISSNDSNMFDKINALGWVKVDKIDESIRQKEKELKDLLSAYSSLAEDNISLKDLEKRSKMLYGEIESLKFKFWKTHTSDVDLVFNSWMNKGIDYTESLRDLGAPYVVLVSSSSASNKTGIRSTGFSMEMAKAGIVKGTYVGALTEYGYQLQGHPIEVGGSLMYVFIKDKALLSSGFAKTPGGIDLNADNLNLKEQGQGGDFNFSFKNFQNVQPVSVNGILPIITNISAVTDFSSLLQPAAASSI